MKIYFYIASIVLTIVFVTIGFILFSSPEIKIPEIRNIHAYVVQSGSMVPEIPVGSLILVQKAISYNVGDIISFKSNGNTKNIFTHRITTIKNNDIYHGNVTYYTQGDANKGQDREEVKSTNVIGKTVLIFPYIGYFISFPRTTKGFIIMIVIPMTIILYEELRSLIHQIKELWKKHFNNIHHANVSNNTRYYTMFIILPVFASLFVVVYASQSYFLDKETSNSNILGVATDYGLKTLTAQSITSPIDSTLTPTPTPTDVISPIATPSPTMATEATGSAQTVNTTESNDTAPVGTESGQLTP